LTLRDSLSASERGEVLGWLGRREEAARAFADALKGPSPDHRVWGRRALLQLARADREGYTQTCADAVQRFGRTKDPAVAGAIAWSCGLAAGALRDLKPAIQLANIAVKSKRTSPVYHAALGMVLYRTGRHAEATRELLKAADYGWQENRIVLFFAAMARYRSGKTNESRTSLAQAVQTLQREQPIDWAHRLELEVCCREGEAILKEPQPGQKK
jgi:tetratricopeptide (TPR) repeat protein